MSLNDQPIYYQAIHSVEEQRSRDKRLRWLVSVPSFNSNPRWTLSFSKLIGGAITIIAIIVVAVAVGVTVSKKKNQASSNTVKQTDPNDPSTFQKDSRLHQSFYGLAYTPEGVQLPNCGAKLSDVITDIQVSK